MPLALWFNLCSHVFLHSEVIGILAYAVFLWSLKFLFQNLDLQSTYTEIYILFLHCLLNNPLVLTELYCKIHTVIYTWILVYILRLVLTLLVWLVVWLVCWLFGCLVSCLVFWWLVNWFWLGFCFWFSWNTEDQSQGLARARQAPYPWATSPAQIATSFHCILCIFCFDMLDMFLSWWIR